MTSHSGHRGGVFSAVCVVCLITSVSADAQVTLHGVRLSTLSSVVQPGRGLTTARDETADSAVVNHGGCSVCRVLIGAGLGLGIHEGGHLLANWAFRSDVYVKKVHGGGIPFFAIAHRGVLPEWQEQVVSSVGFWTQFAAAEHILTRTPEIRSQQAQVRKGQLAFHIGLSVLYGAAGLGQLGPPERDTRGIARGIGVNERWVGVAVLAPGVLDAYRYYRGSSRWARWGSRAAKMALLLPLLTKGR